VTTYVLNEEEKYLLDSLCTMFSNPIKNSIIVHARFIHWNSLQTITSEC